MKVLGIHRQDLVFEGLDISFTFDFELEAIGRCNIIVHRCVDSDENVWWAAPHGINKYDESSDDVVDLPFSDDAVKSIINALFSMLKGGDIWVYDEAGDY